MPRKEALVLESKFIRGLITESTSLNFPTDGCTETYDCVFNEKGYVTRRLGLDLESGYVENSSTALTDEAHVSFVWDSIKSYTNGSFLVWQQGKYLHFFDITDNVAPSANKNATTIDLSTYQILGSATLPTTYRCQFSQANGYLLVVNHQCHPIYIEYDLGGDSFTVNPFILKQRDFVGLDDGLAVTKRLTTTLAALHTSNPEHVYNLTNQGWTPAYLANWDTEATTMPSNADVPAYTRVAVTDLLSASSISANDPGSSPAPKGRYILDVGAPDRPYAYVESYDLFDDTTTEALFALTGYPDNINTTGTAIGDMTNNTANAFDANFNQNAANSASNPGTQTSAYIGRSFSTAKRLSRMLVTASGDNGFNSSATAVRFRVYAKNGAPSNSTDGTLITTVQADSDAINLSLRLDLMSNTLAYTHWWVTMDVGGSAVTFYMCELCLWEAVSQTVSPTAIAFFAGRAWYSGYDDADLGSKLFFSQIIDDPDKFNLCYQTNDPSSEKFPDLLATDGGVINIPEINRVVALFTFQSQLLVLANNGVWIVGGNSAGVFAATEYTVRKISSIGCNSPHSLVDVKGLPLWWGEDAIYTVKYDANYDSTVVEPITEGTIKTFFLAIPSHNRQYAVGAYDKFNDVVCLLYSNTVPFVSAGYNRYTRALLLNLKTGAFYPWTISTSVTAPQSVRGVAYVQDGNRQLAPTLVFPTTYSRSGTYRLTVAKIWGTGYKDWTAYKTLTTNSADEVDYSSYLISGYRLDGSAMTHFQANYVYTYMAKETNASALMQGLYEFTDSSSSVKWTTAQQAYNSKTTFNRTNFDTKVSRLLVRGVGKAMRVKYYSASGLPFTILGWGLFISGNDRV